MAESRTDFNAEEVFEIAQQVERIGQRYYTRAAELSHDDESRELFESLARWEKRHESIFAEMRSQLVEGPEKPVEVDPYSDAAQYLRALVDGKIFDINADPAGRLDGEEPPVEVLEIAMGMEKDSIVFYNGIREMVPPQRGQERVDGIIREEMRHLQLLSKEKNKLEE